MIRLSPASLAALPPEVRRPGYDRTRLRLGMAHVGVGAFHRCHQADFTDDMLEAGFGRWGVAGIQLRPPSVDALAAQDGLYTRVLRDGARAEARVVGCLLRTVDATAAPGPAFGVLAAPDVEVATITVTEKGYCHRPSDGAPDPENADLAHDRAHPAAPRSLPGLLARALELRRRTHGRPMTLISCDNIPGNGAILAGAVAAVADPRLADWIAANVAFPSTMVDRIVPATTAADIEALAAAHGYRDAAAVGGEPFRQWVIEDRFAGRRPPWDAAGAEFVGDVAPYELLKMRVLNAAQTTLAHLGLLAGHVHTHDAVSDPQLADFTRTMLATESIPTLPPLPGTDPGAYLARALGRIGNRAIRHTCQQIATDASQKLPQRLVNPAAERIAGGLPAPRLTVAIAAWMATLVRASPRFGRQWPADDPAAAPVAVIAASSGDDAAALVAGILGLDAVFAPRLAAREELRAGLAAALAGFLGPDPIAVVRSLNRETPCSSAS